MLSVRPQALLDRVAHLGKLQVSEADIIAGDDLVPRPKSSVPGHTAHLHTLHKDPRPLRWSLAYAGGMKEKLISDIKVEE